MFDEKQYEELKASLPQFSVELSTDSSPMTLALQIYMEFYGFFEALKGIEVEYFFGVRPVKVASETNTQKLKIATHFWQLPEPKACVFLVHGLFDHVGLFQGLIGFLLRQGYSVVAIDLPGHGLSEGKRTEVNSFSSYADVLSQTVVYFRSIFPNTACYGLGQSTGAAVIMASVFASEEKGLPQPLERLVFLGPLVRPKGAKFGRIAYKLLRHFIRQTKRNFAIPNSNNSEFHHFLRFHDPLQPRALSLKWIGAMFDWMDEFADQPTVDIPLLIVQGTLDGVVDWRFNVPAIRQHFKGSQVSYVKGAMHHLANESDPWKKVVFNSVSRFFRSSQIRR